MEDNHFTILFWSLPYIKWISYRCTYVPSLLTSLLPPTPSHPSRLSQRTWFELPTSYSKFPLAICFTYGNVYVSMLLSQFIPLSPSPTVPTSLFSMTDSPLLLHCQKLPLYLLTWSYGFHLSVCWWCITMIDLGILKTPCISGINTAWSWCLILLMCNWVLFARIWLRILCIYGL